MLLLALAGILRLRYSSSVPPSGFGILTAVSVGYFAPNVVGLVTLTVTTGASSSSTATGPGGITTTTWICAAFAAILETVMITVICAGTWIQVGGAGSRILRALANDFVEPVRRRRRWYYRVAALEDVFVACLIAIVSNLPRSSSSNDSSCQALAGALLGITLAHLAYVGILRPYRSVLDNGLAIFLAAVNTVFAAICCFVLRDATGASVVSAALYVVAAAFYAMLAIGVAASVHELWAVVSSSSTHS